MNSPTMDWRYEMKKMLMAIDFQASHTLDNIKFAFKRTGYSFDQNFKQYFLDASIEQLKSTYREFEVNLQLEEQQRHNMRTNNAALDQLESIANEFVESDDEVDEMVAAHSDKAEPEENGKEMEVYDDIPLIDPDLIHGTNTTNQRTLPLKEESTRVEVTENSPDPTLKSLPNNEPSKQVQMKKRFSSNYKENFKMHIQTHTTQATFSIESNP